MPRNNLRNTILASSALQSLLKEINNMKAYWIMRTEGFYEREKTIRHYITVFPNYQTFRNDLLLEPSISNHTIKELMSGNWRQSCPHQECHVPSVVFCRRRSDHCHLCKPQWRTSNNRAAVLERDLWLQTANIRPSLMVLRTQIRRKNGIARTEHVLNKKCEVFAEVGIFWIFCGPGIGPSTSAQPTKLFGQPQIGKFR